MNNLFDKRFFLFDFARGRKLIKEETVLLFDTLKKTGYNGVCLHLEGFFETGAYPGIIREGYLTKEEARWFNSTAKEFGFEVIPITNLVGHAESFVYFQERFSHMSKEGSTTQFNLFHPELETLAHNIIDEILELFEPKCLHIGGDETSLNAEEKTEYVKFLSRLCAYITQKGVEPCIWGDMLLSSDDIIEGFTKEVTVFDWYYYGHRSSSLEKFKKYGFKNIFACPCNQGWDGIMGTQHHVPWWGWPTNEPYIDFNEIEAFLSDAASLGIKNALITDWENNNGHNLWSGMDANARAGLYMTGKELSRENIEESLFGRQTPHGEITYLLQRVQNELYMAVLEDKSQPTLKCRMSDAFFAKGHFDAWVRVSPRIIDRMLKYESDITRAEALLNSWDTKSDTEKICKASLNASLHYTIAIFALMKLSSLGYDKYHKAALVQFEDPEAAAGCIDETLGFFSTLIGELEEYKKAHTAYLGFAGQTSRDIVRLTAFIKGMTSIRNTVSELKEHIPENKDNLQETRVLPGWLMLMASMEKLDIQ